MTRILVAEDEKRIRDLLVDILFDAGYDVIEAKDGGEALEKAHQEHPDLILLDVMMPVMDGFEVLGRLREDPDTQDLPVVILTAVGAYKGERAAMDLGVEHYITKPWETGVVEATIKVALREDGIVATPIKIGDFNLDRVLGGAIALGSLALIEGAAAAGKSVLCQQLTYGAIRDGHYAVYFTSGNNARSLVNQMESIGLNVSSYLREDRLRIHPLKEPPPGEDAGPLLVESVQDIESLPRKYKVIVVDSISNLFLQSEERDIMNLFSSCKRLSDGGRTIFLVTHSYVLDESILTRLGSLCDVHFRLHVEIKGTKLVKSLEVRKVQSAQAVTSEVFDFEVEPWIGMRVIATSKARA